MRLLLSYLFLQAFIGFSLGDSGGINKNVLKKRCNFNGILRVNFDLNEYENNPSKFKYIYNVNEIENDALSLYIDKGYCSFLANNYKKIGMKEDDDYYKLKELVVVLQDSYKKNIYDCIDKDNIVILKNNICILKDFPSFTTTTTTTTITATSTTTTNTTTTTTTATSTTTTTTTTTTTPTTTTHTTTTNTTTTTTATSTTTTTTTTHTTTTTTITSNLSAITNSSKNTTNENFISTGAPVITDNERTSSQIHNDNLIISLSISGILVLIVIILFLVKYKRNNKNETYQTQETSEEVISENQELEYEEPNNVKKDPEYDNPKQESLYLEPTPIKPDIHFNPIYEMDE